MSDNQIMTPIAIKLDGVHTGEVKEVLIDQPLSLLVMLINRDTIFETMYCCDGLGDMQLPYIMFKFDYRLYEALNYVFDLMNNSCGGPIRTELQVTRTAYQKQKCIIIRGVLGKIALSIVPMNDKLTYTNRLIDIVKSVLLKINYGVISNDAVLDNYRLAKDIIDSMDYGMRLNQIN